MTPASTTAPHATASAAGKPLPKGPVLGWRSLAGARAATLPWVGSLTGCVPTTSGRAALYQALCALQSARGHTVLVPSYHCPTMVGPVLCAGLEPNFFAIGHDGLPRLDLVSPAQRAAARAIIVAHYFGVVRNLDMVRAWCDEHGIALIEDCAHALFGAVDGHAVGRWGDYCTASISKFLPVSEMGLLASSRRPITWKGQPPGARAQLKGAVDVLEKSCHYGRPAGLAALLGAVFFMKNRSHGSQSTHRGDSVNSAAATDPLLPGTQAPIATVAQMLTECDMGRLDQAPVWAARFIHGLLPRQRMVSRRQRNFDLYGRLLQGLPGSHPVQAERPDHSAPYVYPLWVDDAEHVYERVRTRGMPVFRWDRIWPGLPVMAGDVGPLWSRHVLQLLCHQDLSAADIGRVVDEIRSAIGAQDGPTPRP